VGPHRSEGRVEQVTRGELRNRLEQIHRRSNQERAHFLALRAAQVAAYVGRKFRSVCDTGRFPTSKAVPSRLDQIPGQIEVLAASLPEPEPDRTPVVAPEASGSGGRARGLDSGAAAVTRSPHLLLLQLLSTRPKQSARFSLQPLLNYLRGHRRLPVGAGRCYRTVPSAAVFTETIAPSPPSRRPSNRSRALGGVHPYERQRFRSDHRVTKCGVSTSGSAFYAK